MERRKVPSSWGSGGSPSQPKRGKFLFPSPAHRFDQCRVGMAYEIKKRRRLPVFFPHEKERDERRKEHGGRRQPKPFRGYQLVQPLSLHAVSHLVMILGEDDEFGSGKITGRRPMTPFPVKRILARIDEAFLESFLQVGQAPKVLIISGSLSGQEGAESMVKPVVPLSVEPIAAQFRPLEKTDIVPVAFGKQIDFSIQPLAFSMNRRGKFLEERPGGRVENGVDASNRRESM